MKRIIALTIAFMLLGANLSFAGNHYGYKKYTKTITRSERLKARAEAVIKTDPTRAERLMKRSENLLQKANNMQPKGFGIRQYDRKLDRADMLIQHAKDIAATDPTRAERLKHRADNLLLRADNLADRKVQKMDNVYQRRTDRAEILTQRAKVIAVTNPSRAEQLTNRATRLTSEATWIKTKVETAFK